MNVGDELGRGRESHAGQEWGAAYESLSGADRMTPLRGADLELLATAAYMLGREDEYFAALERGHHAFLDDREPLRAARCAFWVGVNLARRGEMGPASGWLGRAQRLVERHGPDSVESGYLLLPATFQHEAAGEWDAANVVAAEAIEIAERFGDQELFALAAHEQGHVLIKDGQVGAGLALLDEAMVAATSGPLSPIVTGIVYCGVILACQEAYELRRAREWTAVLSRWCGQQPDLVAFTGRCLVHRAEILQLQGDWSEALGEARRASERCLKAMNRDAAGEAAYRRGEVHRLEGDLTAAKEAYREASRHGREPLPGLALLRLAQGKQDAAAAAIQRALGEAGDEPARAALLPARVEIALAVGDLEGAREGCGELEQLGRGDASPMRDAIVAHTRGATELAAGDAGEALTSLRRAFEIWQELEVPYELARTRTLLGLACREIGDEEAAALELEAARATFEELGAEADLARLDSGGAGPRPGDAHDLTPRELEVLRLVAAGETNKAVAAELVVSERTVDRHLSNIFAKLGVSSRTAATAYAYEHQLI